MIPLILSIGRCVIDWISGGPDVQHQCVFTIQTHIQDIFSPSRALQYILQIKNSAKCLGHWCPVGQDVSLTSNDMCELANGIYRVLFLICVYTYERGWVTYF